MLDYLFQRLTKERSEGVALFSAATQEARRPHWFRKGEVPDTIDGRFAVLSTIIALILVRLERAGDVGNAISVALTERFIAVMESEHRELGLGDPTLGKTVRKLVGLLAKRTQLWRDGVAASDLTATTRASVYRGEVNAGALDHSAVALGALRDRLERTSVKQLAEGKIE